MEFVQAAERVVAWLEKRVVNAARGDEDVLSDHSPADRFWIGKLNSEESVIAMGLGERGERLDPCAVGLRVKPAGPPPWKFAAHVRLKCWLPNKGLPWQKTPALDERISVVIDALSENQTAFGSSQMAAALGKLCGQSGLSAEIRIEYRAEVPELTIMLVNSSPENHTQLKDTNLYECELALEGLDTAPFALEALPDSFRYDRNVPAYGINCGVLASNGVIRTTDTIVVDRRRPRYWGAATTQPTFSFADLSTNAVPLALELVEALEAWGVTAWGETTLANRATLEKWSAAMQREAKQGSVLFGQEQQRIRDGIELLEKDPLLHRAFRLMNASIRHSAAPRGYSAWRPFQFGFLLANLASIAQAAEDSDIADVVWFATGGGKTETYLGLLLTAAFYDRLTGKASGITAWSRFPLRMLSLQQTQRFADALAGAELTRLKEGIGGDPFSLGFFVGGGSTPNKIRADSHDELADPDDENMPARFRILETCPFCASPSIQMEFNRLRWTLEHRCTSEHCPWGNQALPFYIVDDEIYRFLPTVVVGTVDKTALLGFSAQMRGFLGPPWGVCSEHGHGHTYAPRSKEPTGCLVPGCPGKRLPLPIPAERYAPSFRLQDELHLLKDSLGAVGSHYESALDDLQLQLCGRRAKILASSATLTGYEKQVDVLYQRSARVFPQPGPSSSTGFWTSDGEDLARRFVGVSPRGATQEYALDRTLTELQRAIREIIKFPEKTCAAIGVPVAMADNIVRTYGVDVVYGNTLRDLDAVARSLETQVQVDGPLNTAQLTGRTGFEEVRSTTSRLQTPEAAFDERIHVITASSMMSHGVDIDRLNVMTMVGLPLATAEFIQATARVGRKWPGLIFVFHRVARERDASVFRAFDKFVHQGDRFVDAIPITRRSRRVLERTLPGMMVARVYEFHEPRAAHALTTIPKLREYFRDAGVGPEAEASAILRALGFDESRDPLLAQDTQNWLSMFFRNLEHPTADMRFISHLCPQWEPMRSLRDVEESADVKGTSDR